MKEILLTLILGLLLSLPAVAGDMSPDRVNLSRLDQGLTVYQDLATGPAPGEDRQLEMKKADFLTFAVKKISEMNRNHILSRDRMRIDQGPDGLYRALFHEIDDTTLSCQVSRSKTGSAPYVAVLSYQELVYATSCATPEACRQGAFQPVEAIPNRHIFVYSNGSWQ